MIDFAVQEKIDDFIAATDAVFSLADAIRKFAAVEPDELYDYLCAAELLMDPDTKTFCRSEVFFKNREFLITPREFEIKTNILFPGDRFSPFCSEDVFPSECSMHMAKKCFKANKLFKGQLEKLASFHSLLGAENIMDYFVADSPANERLFENTTALMPLELNVFDFKDLYAEHKFEVGDALKVCVRDYEKGIFDFSVLKKSERDEAVMEKFLGSFEDAMDKVIEEFGNYLDIGSQLAQAFFFDGNLTRDPQLSCDELMHRSESLAILIEDNYTIIGRREALDQAEEDIEIPDNMFASLGPVHSLEAILKDIKYPLSVIEIDAFILDAKAHEYDDFDAFFRRCFGLEKLSFADDVQQCAFLNFIEDRWEVLGDNYSAKHDQLKAPLREQILEFCEQKMNFLLDNASLPELSGEILDKLAVISRRLNAMLKLLSSPEYELDEEQSEVLSESIEAVGCEQKKILDSLTS